MGRSQPRSAPARRRVALAMALLALVTVASGALVVPSPQRAAAAGTSGYWLVGTDGGIFSFGQATFYGSTGDIRLNQPIVGMAATPTGRGYWMVASDGGIFAFGDAGFYGSMGAKPLNKPIVAITPTKTGRGYWMVASDGGIFAFGDAGFYGSMGGEKLNKPIVDMAMTPSGRGYWLAATDGGIFAFGDAAFLGSTGDIKLVQRIHAMAAAPSGRGYWMVAGDGGIFAFGDAGFYGSAAGGAAEKRVIDLAASASGAGYYVTTSNGQVISFGDANHYGGTEDIKLNHRIAAMAAMNGNQTPIAVDDVLAVDEDKALEVDVLANDRDPDGGPVTLRSANPPLRGSAGVVGGKISYKPNPDYNGNDSFTYTIADESGDIATGRVNVTVKAIDDRPKLSDDTALTLEDAPLPVPVLLNDHGLGDGIKNVAVTAQPAHGSATVNPDRSITYRPAENYAGDDFFDYKVTDTDDDSGSAKVKITIVPVNDIPAAVDDVESVQAGRGVTIDVEANDSSPDGVKAIKFADPAGNPTEANDIVTAAGGTAKLQNGKIAFMPARGFTGSDTFRYVLIDRDDDVSPAASVRVSVGTNEPAEVRDGFFTVAQGQTVEGNLADLVVNNPGGDSLTFILKSGSVEIKSDGRFVYGPAGAPGTDTFTFAVDDGNAESNVATVTIRIDPPPAQ